VQRLLDLIRQANPAQYAHHAALLIVTRPEAPAPSTQLTQESGRFAAEGLRALQALLAEGAARDSIVAFRTDLEAARQQIEILSYYKRLHDLFSQVQDRYRLVESDRRRLPADATAWDGLAINGPELENTLGDILDAIGRVASAADEVWWTSQACQARDELHMAIENCAAPPLQVAVQRLNRVLSREPSRVNTRLVMTAGALRLAAIVGAVTVVLERLPDRNGDSVAVSQLREGAAALARLDGKLRDLVGQHNTWQAISDELRRVENNWNQDVAELTLAWPDLKALTASLCAESAAWAAALQAAGADLETAILSGDPVRIRRLFQRYRCLAERRFNQIDQELFTLCEELRKIGEPLDLLLRAL
jgi:hypothetical protein